MVEYKREGGKLYANVNGTTWLEEGRCLEPGVWGEIREEDCLYIESIDDTRVKRARLYGLTGGPSESPTNSTPRRSSDHYAYPDRDDRLAIVRHYRKEKAAGCVSNKDGWANTNYQITGRTLLNYEREFPEEL